MIVRPTAFASKASRAVAIPNGASPNALDTSSVERSSVSEAPIARRDVEGAFHCPRGMLEFWIDPESPYHKPVFAQDKRFVFFCAGGMRSALAAAAAQDMGLSPVAHLEGGFAAWRKAGGPVEAPTKQAGPPKG